VCILYEKYIYILAFSRFIDIISRWKWPAQGINTVLIVSAHFRSLCNDSLSYTTPAYLAYNSPIVEWSIVISVSVYLSVCVCLSAIISSDLYVQFSPFFVHVIYGCGSVLICWHSDKLCTSGFWMTSYLLISHGCSKSPLS